MDKQYLQLLRDIKEKGTYKAAARENMPGTMSLFGYQMRHSLNDGFPLLTTKKMYWKGVVVELLWFLRGDTNIKYLVDNGVNIWNEDAYNYYKKIHKQQNIDAAFTYNEFVNHIKVSNCTTEVIPGYKFGDCGYQYGKLWRAWDNEVPQKVSYDCNTMPEIHMVNKPIDQVADLIKGLKENPMSRRHIITAWNPATLDKMALNACHVLVQFNCKPIDNLDRIALVPTDQVAMDNDKEDMFIDSYLERRNIPKYYLDCQLYQRSADVFLGVPFNIASYALLTHILAKICNMVPGEFIHTFGDVHCYETHMEAVDEQLSREPRELPKLELPNNVNWENIDTMIESCLISDFSLMGYNPHSAIKAELSTGLKK